MLLLETSIAANSGLLVYLALIYLCVLSPEHPACFESGFHWLFAWNNLLFYPILNRNVVISVTFVAFAALLCVLLCTHVMCLTICIMYRLIYYCCWIMINMLIDSSLSYILTSLVCCFLLCLFRSRWAKKEGKAAEGISCSSSTFGCSSEVPWYWRKCANAGWCNKENVGLYKRKQPPGICPIHRVPLLKLWS